MRYPRGHQAAPPPKSRQLNRSRRIVAERQHVSRALLHLLGAVGGLLAVYWGSLRVVRETVGLAHDLIAPRREWRDRDKGKPLAGLANAGRGEASPH
jgi:hypothetical protein